MSLISRYYEHLITKPKYNKKCIECDSLREDIARINIRMKEQKDMFLTVKKEWDDKLKDQENEIIKLKKKIIKLKGE